MTTSGSILRERLSFILLGKGGQEEEAPSIDAMLVLGPWLPIGFYVIESAEDELRFL